MTHRMFKYTLPIDGQIHTFKMTRNVMPTLVLPSPVAADLADFWAENDDEGFTAERHFTIVGTGHVMPPPLHVHGTFQMLGGRFVGHLVETVRAEW